MARIAGEFAFNVAKEDDKSLSQDLTSMDTHFCGFDYEGKFKMMAVGDVVSLYAQAPTPWDMVLEPDAALSGICSTVGFGVDTGDICDRDRSRQYCIVLEGTAPGTGKLFLRHEKTRAVLDQIDVQVVQNRLVQVRFYNLRDKVGHEGCSEYLQRRYPYLGGELNTTVARVNYIVQRQAAVRMSLIDGPHSTVPLRVLNVHDLNLGDDPDLDELILKVYGKSGFDGDADYHVCFVWGSIRAQLGSTKNNMTFLNLPDLMKVKGDAKLVRVIAHEYVHFLSGAMARGLKSHDPKDADLMHDGYPHGVQMRKKRLQMIIR
jgi:hypothetical protein